MVLTTVPVLIGEGKRLFGPTGRDIPLRRLSSRPLGAGMVQTVYAVG